MNIKMTAIAASLLAATSAFGAASWKNLDDKSYMTGDKLTTDDFFGKVVLVYYFDASSDKNNAEVEKVWSSYKTKKFIVVGSYQGANDAAKVKEIVSKGKLSFPVYHKFSMDPDPKPSWQNSAYFCVSDHRGTSKYTGASVKEATAAVVNAISEIGMPVSLCGDVEVKKFKGLAAQLKLGRNVSNAVKTLTKESQKAKDPNVASEAQELLSAVDKAKDDVKEDIEIMKKIDPAEALKLIQLFMKTWPKDDAVAGYKDEMAELKKAAAEKAKADKAKAKEKPAQAEKPAAEAPAKEK